MKEKIYAYLKKAKIYLNKENINESMKYCFIVEYLIFKQQNKNDKDILEEIHILLFLVFFKKREVEISRNYLMKTNYIHVDQMGVLFDEIIKRIKLYQPIIGLFEKQDNKIYQQKLDAKNIYKTYKGKRYTKEEWDKFEQKEYENYLQKNNIKSKNIENKGLGFFIE